MQLQDHFTVKSTEIEMCLCVMDMRAICHAEIQCSIKFILCFCFFSFKACGFEILVAQTKPASQEDKQTQNPVDLGGDRGWNQYLNSLKKTGYFKVWCKYATSPPPLLKRHNPVVTSVYTFYVKILIFGF
jgi:hypothetical protein